MPDIFMHFVFRRWFTHKPQAWQPPTQAQEPPPPPPRPPPDRR
jgi:hypothetical protein